LKNFSVRAALFCAALASILSAQVATPPGPSTGSTISTILQSTAGMPAIGAVCTSYNLDYLNYQTGERRVCVAGLIEPSGLGTEAIGTAIASASTIAPVAKITHVTGTTNVVTITPPAAYTTAGYGGCIVLIPDGLWSTTNAGNIAIATTGVVSKQLNLCYDATAAKWYPSY
jgi:hypothetical protein